MNAITHTDRAFALAGSALDAYSEMLATLREQTTRVNLDGYAYANHRKGSVQRTVGRPDALLSIRDVGFSVGVHGFTVDDLRSLAAACIATADAMESQP